MIHLIGANSDLTKEPLLRICTADWIDVGCVNLALTNDRKAVIHSAFSFQLCEIFWVK
jgi:hypothetical protein